jgi:exodeoxyribonuclease V gamma subunit
MQQWMKKKLSSQGAAGAQFNRGVTFSTMVPVRSIPFRVIALIGLNEGVFPRKSSAPDFDLMLQYPDPSDRNRRNEDRNLFLESMMAAGDIHYTSYIGRSHVDNEPLPPSPVVSEWISFLSDITGLKEDDIVLRVPLTGYSASAFSGPYRAWSEVHFRTAQAFQGIATGANGLYSGETLPPPADVENGYVDLGKLVSRVVHPLRGFVRDRMNAALSDPEDEKQEFEINGLERHRIFDRLFKWRLHNREKIDFEQVILSSGILPAGRPGVMELNELMLTVDRALEAIRKSGFEPELNHMDVDVRTREIRVQGEIQSYSALGFLDLSASSKSAVNMLQTWVRHLLLSAMYPDKERQSILICELKKDPVIVTFAAVDEPEKYLEPIVDLFTDSGEKPVLFFPKTVMAYVENLEEGDEAARKKAALEFEGTGFDYSWPERDDLNSAVMLGIDAELSDQMLDERFCDIISGMLKHMGEG